MDDRQNLRNVPKEDTKAEGPKMKIISRYLSYTNYYIQSMRGWNKMLLLGILLLYFVPIFMDYLWPGDIRCSENFEGLLTVILVFGSWILSISILMVVLLLASPYRLRRAEPAVVTQSTQ